MKSKSVLTLLVFAAAPAAAFLLRIYIFNHSDTIVTPKTVTPKTSSAHEKPTEQAPAQEASVLTSFVPLLATESLISTAAFDFDGDGLDDQIAAVHRAGLPTIFLIAGLYNPELNSYVRSAEIATEIVKTRTFSYSGRLIWKNPFGE